MATVNVHDLLAQLTLEEKILLLAGKNFWETHEIDRLHIPSLKVTDGPSGARGAQFLDGTRAACFPACVSLASTFDRELARRIGKALAEETQSKGAYVLLGPTVCCHRSPLGGRNFEAFSEDPLLSGLMASEYVKGLQSERVAATVKHFFANEQDTRRFVVNEKISERAIREIYLKAFEIVVKESDPWCLMSAYPKVNGSYIDATDKWLNQVLRKEWGFKGLTMTDWGAGTTVESIRNGLDLEMPGPANSCSPTKVQQALKNGTISVADIDTRVFKLLKLLERVGKFADRRATPAEQAIDRPEHRALIREAGGAGAVLLKNEAGILPIDMKSKKKIALLGPLAKHASAHSGGSSFLTCHYKISPFEAFCNRFGEQVEFTYSKGAHIFRSLPDLLEGTTNSRGDRGFDVEYMENHEATGKSFHTGEVLRSYFSTHDQIEIKGRAMSARLSTTYCPTETGRHYISLSGAGHTKLFINDELIAEQKDNVRDAMAFISGVQDELRVQYPFEASKSYQIRVDTMMPTESVSDNYILDNQLCAHLGFVSEAEMDQDLQGEAAALAGEADIAIVFTGNTFQWESEGQDMDAMVLPPYHSRVQDSLVKAVAAANPQTVVVNTTGVPVEVPWLNDVAAFVQAWYGGQETGNSIVDVLVGDVDTSGRLPVSWPRHYEHTACYGHFGLDSLESREVEYVEGVYVGYRHFDRFWGTEKEVLFPFGYGLSYTDFNIDQVSVSGALSNDSKEQVTVSIHVQNVGQRDGSQTLQLYLVPPKVPGVERPVKTLGGFSKVKLRPGEEQVTHIQFTRDAAACWDERARQWKVEAGQYEILISTSSRPEDVKAKKSLVVEASFTFDP